MKDKEKESEMGKLEGKGNLSLSNKFKAILGVLFPPYGLYEAILYFIRKNEAIEADVDRKRDIQEAKRLHKQLGEVFDG